MATAKKTPEAKERVFQMKHKGILRCNGQRFTSDKLIKTSDAELIEAFKDHVVEVK